MRIRLVISLLAVIAVFSFVSFGQVVVVVDPTKPMPEKKLSAANQISFDRVATLGIKKNMSSNGCTAEPEVAGFADGSFSKPNSKQTIIFYQYCQTGNGLGWAGLLLIENGEVIANYMADSGWTLDLAALPDINKNGLDEFALSWGGGMHQGQGGVGVDIMEFARGVPRGLGWFLAEQFDDTQASNAWKVTVKPGKVPVFYRQKYFSGENEKWTRVGANTMFTLKKAFTGKFEVVK